MRPPAWPPTTVASITADPQQPRSHPRCQGWVPSLPPSCHPVQYQGRRQGAERGAVSTIYHFCQSIVQERRKKENSEGKGKWKARMEI